MYIYTYSYSCIYKKFSASHTHTYEWLVTRHARCHHGIWVRDRVDNHCVTHQTMNIHIHTYIHTYTYIYIYIYMYIHVCVYVGWKSGAATTCVMWVRDILDNKCVTNCIIRYEFVKIWSCYYLTCHMRDNWVTRIRCWICMYIHICKYRYRYMCAGWNSEAVPSWRDILDNRCVTGVLPGRDAFIVQYVTNLY